MKIAPISFTNKQKTKNKEHTQSAAFGYSFFLKGIPKVHCAYCARPTLSIPEINHLAQTLEHSNGNYALPIFKKLYNFMDNAHKVIIDILETEIDEKPKANLKEIIVNLASKFEDATNQRYASALDSSLEKSQIKKGTILYKLLDNTIVESQKKFLTNPDNKSGQKVLRISVLQDGVINLIKKTFNPDDKKKLKIFLKEVNTEFRLIKMDPSTFFAKFGKDTMSSFLASLSAPIRATADHIVTASNKGVCDKSNYILSCGKCNWDRSDKPFKDFIASKPEILIHNIQRQFSQLDHRLSRTTRNGRKLTPQQHKELTEYLSIVPDVIQENSGINITFNLPNTQQILASKAIKT